MIKYAQIANEETKQVNVGLGTDTEFFKSLGMTEMDVEQCEHNGLWYLKGYAPKKSKEQEKEERILELKDQLDKIDLQTIRSLRALQAGIGTAADREKLEECEAKAASVREELQKLLED